MQYALYLIPALFAALALLCVKLERVYRRDGDDEEARACKAVVIAFGALAVLSFVCAVCAPMWGA